MAILASVVKADQPVNCLRQQFHDQWWSFHVSKESNTINLFETNEVCGHQIPNRIQIMSNNHKFKFETEDVYQVMIHSDFSAEARLCKDGNLHKCEQQTIPGKWQAYYDQALMVELSNNLRFIANFRYEIKKNVTANPMKTDFKKLLKLIQDDVEASKVQFDSLCNQTMVGFVQNTTTFGTLENHPVTCFYGHKDYRQLYEDQVTPDKKQKNVTMHQEDNVPVEAQEDSSQLLVSNQEQ